MPNKTIYVKDSDTPLWDAKAKESISAEFARFLREEQPPETHSETPDKIVQLEAFGGGMYALTREGRVLIRPSGGDWSDVTPELAERTSK